MSKTLQCHSKGDKRFSALYAKVEINGVTDTIERWYQNCKRDIHGDRVGKGQPVDHIVWKGVERPASDLTPLYEWLWRKYFEQNPNLLIEASKYDEFVDIFKGKSRNCQADVIKKLVIEYRSQNNKEKKEEEKTMKNKPLKTQEAPVLVRSAAHFYNLAINPETRNLENKFLITKSSFKTIADVMSVHDNIKNSKERINIVTQDGILDAKARLLSIKDMCKYYTNVPVVATTSKQLMKFAKLGAKKIVYAVTATRHNKDYYIVYDAIVSYKIEVQGIDYDEMVKVMKNVRKYGLTLPKNPELEKQVLSKNFTNTLKNIRNITCRQIKQEFTKCVTFEEAHGVYISPADKYYSTIVEKKEGEKVTLGADAYKTVEYIEYIPIDPTYVVNLKCDKKFEKEIIERVKNPEFLKKIKGLKVQVNGGEVFTFKKEERPIQEDTGYELIYSTSEMLDVVSKYYNLKGFVNEDEIIEYIINSDDKFKEIKNIKLDNNKILAMLDYISVFDNIDKYVNVEKLRSAYIDLLEDEEYDRNTVVHFGNEIYFEAELFDYLGEDDEEEDEDEEDEFDEDEYEEDDDEDDEE